MSQPPPQTPSILRTARLDLIAATVELVQAEMEADLERFAAMLGVAVPAAWPPPLNDRDSQQWMLDMLQTSPSQWGLYYCVLRDGRELVGNAGFKGAPVKGGVEIGYSILEAHQRRGYATEAARALVAYALEQPEVQQVVAETLPDLVPSIGVMAKCGMVFIGEGNPEGELRTVRYAVPRVARASFAGCPLPAPGIESQLRRASHMPPSQGTHLKVRAIYPGSFDPLTHGHLDLIERGSKIFDELVVAILRNPEKHPLFTVEERTDMLRALIEENKWRNVQVDTFEGLLVDYAVRKGAKAVLRGIRAISDYEYELQMALLNRKLEPDLETVFMMPAVSYSYLSSRLVKELFELGGPVSQLVPPLVEQKLFEKVHGGKKSAKAGKKRRAR